MRAWVREWGGVASFVKNIDARGHFDAQGHTAVCTGLGEGRGAPLVCLFGRFSANSGTGMGAAAGAGEVTLTRSPPSSHTSRREHEEE